MAKFTNHDQMLLTEAYSVQMLKESFPKMSLSQLEAKLPYFNISEATYIEEFSEKVIEELFGGLKALAGGAGNAAKKAGGGLLQKGIDTAKQVGSGVASGAKQVGQNVRDIYQGAEGANQAEQAVKQASAAAQQLVQLVQAAQQKGLVTFSGDPMQLPLEDIVNELILAQQGANSQSQSAQKQGVFGSAGKAFQKGFQNP